MFPKKELPLQQIHIIANKDSAKTKPNKQDDHVRQDIHSGQNG